MEASTTRKSRDVSISQRIDEEVPNSIKQADVDGINDLELLQQIAGPTMDEPRGISSTWSFDEELLNSVKRSTLEAWSYNQRQQDLTMESHYYEDEELEFDIERERVRMEESIWNEGYEGEMEEEKEEVEEEVGGYRGGEETEEEEESSFPEEKSEELTRQVEEPDHGLAEVPAEVLADREATIARLKEVLAEQTELKRRNGLLEFWVAKHLRKMKQKMAPVDESIDPEQMEQIYGQALRAYKLQLDEILAQETQLTFEIQSYKDKVQMISDRDRKAFNDFLERVREVAVGLIYAKTGRKITEKIVNEIVQRQVARRDILAKNRYNYIYLQHRFKEIIACVKDVETLGEGMTTMDYEALRMANITFKDKLDEKDQELEKLRFKIAQVVNGVAHYKEKEACLLEDIEQERRKFGEYRDWAAEVRMSANKLHLVLRDLQQAYNEKRLEAGLLIAQPELRKMERMMKLLDALRNDIGIIEQEIRQYAALNTRRQRRDRTPSALTMTKGKRRG
ncbi:hypothetical protein KM043_016733 [Ampulex compressa]|nr:hypothetical protein KM043_016733 [Ampulex compressa]